MVDLNLLSGGVAYLAGGAATVIADQDEGLLVVSAGGSAFDASVANGGAEIVASGGLASGTLVQGIGNGLPAQLVVESGGLASGTEVAAGGVEVVASGGRGGRRLYRDRRIAAGAERRQRQLHWTGRQLRQRQPGGAGDHPGATGLGNSASGTTVTSGQPLYVVSGGRVNATVIASGAIENFDGGSESATVISGGAETVISGAASGSVVIAGSQMVYIQAAAVGTMVSGGVQYVIGGATAGTQINFQGRQTILAGTATATVVSGGYYLAEQVVAAGGTADASVLVAGGMQTVHGGTARGTLVSNGNQYIASGTAFGAVVDSGAVQSIAGGSVFGSLLSGGEQVVYAGMASATVVSSAGWQDGHGGSAVGTIVDNGGSEWVENGSLFSATDVRSGGVQIVYGAEGVSPPISRPASAIGTVVDGGGLQGVVSSGGSVFNTHLGAGARQVIVLGLASGTTLASGAVQIVSGGSVRGTEVGSGASETIVFDTPYSNSALIATTIDPGGSVTVSSGANVAGAVTFGPPGGTLSIADPAMFTATISGFYASDRIDLPDLTFSDAGSATLSGGQLRVSEGGVTNVLTLDPTGLAGATFTLANDGSGGTLITDNVACFVAGTRIATARGDIPIETLGLGDRVQLAQGGLASVMCLGHRRLHPHQHARPRDVQPVRNAAHAFGPGWSRRAAVARPCGFVGQRSSRSATC